MAIRKAFVNNKHGTVVISVPRQFCEAIGLTGEDNVNIELVGKTLHISKVVLQGV